MKTADSQKKPKRSDYRQLFEALLALQSRKECDDFLRDLCTPAELEALADRWRAVRLLKAGKTYRQISQQTGMSVTTVGRVARYLEMGNGGYETVYQRLYRTKR